MVSAGLRLSRALGQTVLKSRTVPYSSSRAFMKDRPTQQTETKGAQQQQDLLHTERKSLRQHILLLRTWTQKAPSNQTPPQTHYTHTQLDADDKPRLVVPNILHVVLERAVQGAEVGWGQRVQGDTSVLRHLNCSPRDVVSLAERHPLTANKKPRPKPREDNGNRTVKPAQESRRAGGKFTAAAPKHPRRSST